MRAHIFSFMINCVVNQELLVPFINCPSGYRSKPCNYSNYISLLVADLYKYLLMSQTVFWIRIRIQIRIHLIFGIPDTVPIFRDMDLKPDPDPSISKKNIKKNLDSYCLVTSFGLFFYLFYLQKVISRNFFLNLVFCFASWRSTSKIALSGFGPESWSITERHRSENPVHQKYQESRTLTTKQGQVLRRIRIRLDM
jgi:hypothetical protein